MLLCPRWYALQPYLLPDALRLSGLQNTFRPDKALRRIRQCAPRTDAKKPIRQDGLLHLFDAWQFPTLAWGDPTLPSALRRFTSEFGMGSGGTTALQPPGKFCLSTHLSGLSM